MVLPSLRFIAIFAVLLLFFSPAFAENCMLITSPGSYSQTQDYVGAPYSAAPINFAYACVKIASSNVLFDCNGHNITGNNPAQLAYGIFVNGSYTNVTIRNCRSISNYTSSGSSGIFLLYAQNSTVQNATVKYNYYGIEAYHAVNISVNDVYAENNVGGFFAEMTNSSTFTHDSATFNSEFGFDVGGEGNTIRHSYSRYNGGDGIRIYSGSLFNSTSSENDGSGVYTSGLAALDIYGNNMNNNKLYGIYLYNTYSKRIFNNSYIYGNQKGGIYIGSNSRSNEVFNNSVFDNYVANILVGPSWNNRVYGNRVYEGFSHGILLNGQGTEASSMPNRLENNSVYNNSGIGVYLNYSNYSILTGNEVFNNSGDGFYLAYSSYNVINSTRSYQNQIGFALSQSDRNAIEGASSSDNSLQGFYITFSDYNNITNSSAYQNGLDGIYLVNSSSTRLYYTNSTGNGRHGFSLEFSSGNSIWGCRASGNDYYGFYLFDTSTGNTIRDSTASGNVIYGFYVYPSAIENTLLGNTAYNHNTAGIYVRANKTADSHSHYYNNSIDYLVEPEGSSIFINATNISIDGPSGGYANYTALSFTDTAGSGEKYSIKWASTASTPSGRTLLRGKMVNITALAGTPSIDSMTWSWAASELTGNFPELWRRSGSDWTLVSSMDSSTLSITLTDVNPASEYAVMQTGCPVITAGGSYTLGVDAVGAPNDAYPVAQYACVKIAASNVVFDCGGHSITDNGTSLTYISRGILLNGSLTNVTIRNCPAVSNYTYGFTVHQSNSSSIYNSTAYENQVGFHFYQSNYNVISGNSAHDQISQGFYLAESSYNNFTANSANNNGNPGFLVRTNSNHNLFTNNVADGNSYVGFLAYDQSRYNVFTGNNASSNSWYGYWLYNTSDCNLTDNFASSNSECAVYINSSTDFIINGMLISNQTCWVGPENGSSLKLGNFTAIKAGSSEVGTTSVVFSSVNYSGNGLDESVFAIGDGFVALDSSARPEFNTSATITMPIASCNNPRIYVSHAFPVTRYDIIGAGTFCNECTILSCKDNMITFTVPHWSGYAVGGEISLFIDNDGPKYANETITFTANYSNATSGSSITGADCLLSLWNGSSYTMPESGGLYVLPLNITDVGSHSYNVTCNRTGYETLTASDTFTIFYNGTLEGVDLYAANIIVGSTGRYVNSAAAGNVTTEGGNVSGVDLSSNASTDRWAGFYGNVTGNILLSQSSALQAVYTWLWNPSNGGVACASTGSAAPTSLVGGTFADIDTAWGFPPSAADSAANTFNNSNCSQSFGPTTLANAYYADTGSAGGFITCAWKSIPTPAKADMFFCSNITQNGTLFNGGAGDYEIMVPTAYGTGVYETYYFYVNLN